MPKSVVRSVKLKAARNCKLTKADVAEIRALYAKGLRAWSYSTLAKKYGVSDAAIRDVVKRNTWRSL